MSFNPTQFRELVVQPTLRALAPEIPYSEVAVELLMLTCAAESDFGTYLKQVGGGPALGVYQMEPATYFDICQQFLAWHDWITSRLRRLHSELDGSAEEMVGNLAYATALARVHYFRRPEPLPASVDPVELATYYKLIWNTPAGRATVEGVVAKYRRYVLGA